MTTSATSDTRPPFDPDRWLELVKVGSEIDLRRELQECHPADIALVLEQLPYELQVQLFSLLDPEVIHQVAAELDEHDQARLIGKLPSQEIADIAEKLESDDATDLIAILKDKKAEEVLNHLKVENRAEITELMTYDGESAGGIMAKEALSVPMDAKVKNVINELRQRATELGDIYYTYVIDNAGILIGYFSLKNLILAQPDQEIHEIMRPAPVNVNVNMDREDVAQLFMRYDLASAPVVDDSGRFLGRITHDDILDVITEEAHEDMAHMTGQAEFDPGERMLFRNLRHRLPWLILGLVGGLLAARVVAYFEPQLTSITALVFFLPLVAAMGGNAGIQTSSLMVRGLATGEIGSYGIRKRLAGELGVAFLTGLVCAGLLFLATWIWQQNIDLALVVSLSLMAVVFFAAFVGLIIPLILKKFGFDPALATGPFITTTNDIIGLLIYLGIAAIFLTRF